MDLAYTIGITLLTLGVLVAVHEFGHFWVARRCGVKVLRFSIGFGYLAYDRLAIDRAWGFDRDRPICKEIGIGVEQSEQSLGIDRFQNTGARQARNSNCGHVANLEDQLAIPILH